MRMSLGLWVALVACLGGVAYQLKAIEKNRDGDGAPVVVGWSGDFKGKSEVSTSVVRSTRLREISERRAYFDFESLEGSALAPRFFKANSRVREMVTERHGLNEQLRNLRAQGLGRKHPDMVRLAEKVEALEDVIKSRWKTFQAERGRR